MKVLMFGWEFPPHISGGLGTACEGLTRELAQLNDVEVTFVVPKCWGDEDAENITLLGASQVPVIHQQIQFADLKSKIDYYELHSGLIPYLGTAEYEALKSEIPSGEKELVELTSEGKILFDGSYGHNLFQEIDYYALVAEKLARELDFDVIHVHDWMCFPAGIAASRVSAKPLIAHVHSTEFDRSGKSVNPSICSIEKKGLEYADKIIAVSNLTRTTIVQKYGISPRKVITIYNGVESIVEHMVTKSSGRFGADKVVSFLGRITAQKGPEYFIETASLIIQKMKNVRFVMAGKGDMLSDMKQKAALLNISGYFHFPGFLTDEEIKELFLESDVFIMPSVSEPFGIVALEAMQAGVPVVISKQSGVSEIVKNAIKVNYWDIEEMAERVCRLLNEPKRRRRLAEKGKEEALKLGWRKTALEVFKQYHSMVNDAGC